MIESGYFVENSVLSDEQCDDALNALASASAHRSRAGVRNLMSVEPIADLANDPRLIEIAKRFTEKQMRPYKATIFEKTGKANWLVAWHQDTALPLIEFQDSDEWGPWSKKAGVNYAHAPAWALARIVALRVHLDRSDSSNGPLRVIEGSHKFGVLSDQQIQQIAGNQRGTSCLADKGGVIGMSPLLLHASSKANSELPRRVLHIEYSDSLDLSPGIRLAIA